jgi:hypothetical protein
MRASAWALLAMVLAATAGSAENRLAQTPWFPLEMGTTWHYRAGDGKYFVRVAAHEKVGDALCARLEAVRDGRVIATEHVRVKADGVYRVDIDIRRGDEVHRQSPQPPILLLPLPPRNGQTFSVDSKVDGKVYKGTFKIAEEEIKVPSGTYKSVAVTSKDLEAEGIQPSLTTWYAQKVGMVKQVIAAGGQKVEIVLEKFEPGK